MRIRILFTVVLLGLVATSSTRALTYVHVSDQGLTEQADVIARVEVIESRVVTTGRQIHTEHTMRIQDLLKGQVDGAYLTVKVPGGRSEELGVVLEFPGAPVFETGNSALLFVKPDDEGMFHVLHFALGNFRETLSEGARVFVRNLPDPVGTDAPPRNVARDADRFESWIRSTVAGIEREADYLVPWTEEPRGLSPAAFTVRDKLTAWSEFHETPPRKVNWKRHKIGQKGVPGKGKSELKTVFKVLNKTPDSLNADNGLVNLAVKGKVSTKKLPNIGNACDDDNFFVFNDVVGIRPDFVCTGSQVGGVLAAGGSCRTIASIGDWKGEPYFGASSGRVIFNANTACYYRGDSPFNRDTARNKFAEVAMHEVLHALGILHSCGDDETPKCSKSDVLDDATMRASVHADGRGAAMRDDDLAAFWQLYDLNFFATGCHLEPGHKKFCKACGPCGLDQGKCTKNKQCFGDLKCKSNSSLGYKTCQ